MGQRRVMVDIAEHADILLVLSPFFEQGVRVGGLMVWHNATWVEQDWRSDVGIRIGEGGED